VARKLKSDKVLFLATLLLVCVGVVMVYSATTFHALESWDDRYKYVTKQALWAILGVAGLALAMRIDYRVYRNEAFIYGLVGVIVLMLIAVLFKTPIKGARRWLGLGSLGIQPSEFAKLVCVLFTALILERRMHRIDEVRYSLLPIGIVVGCMIALIFKEPDMGTAVSMFLVVAVMVFAAGLSYRYVVGVALAALPTLYLAVILAPYRMRRFMAFLDPYSDPRHEGWQPIQSMIAVATGGLFGKGLTHGVQKLSWLPEPHTDFIYAVIGEELGIIGTTAVLLCFCAIAWRGIRIALRTEDSFGAFLAVGLTTMICAQALINMCVVLSLLPTKGIPLPLVSFGGSSLLVSLVGIGLLLNISQHAMTMEPAGPR
jgi:cell division protein FtsW